MKHSKALRIITASLVVGGLLLTGAVLSQRIFHQADANGIPPDDEALFYSGLLLDGASPVVGPTNMAISFFDNAAGAGSPECVVTSPATILTAGHFRIPLDDAACTTAIRNADPGSFFVQVSVDGVSLGLSPFGAVPYAVEADHVRDIEVDGNGNVNMGSDTSQGTTLTVTAQFNAMRVQGGTLNQAQFPFSVEDNTGGLTIFSVGTGGPVGNVTFPNAVATGNALILRHAQPTIDFDNAGTEPRMQISTVNGGMVFNDFNNDSFFRFKTLSGVTRMNIDSAGNVTAGGSISGSSSRSLKNRIRKLSSDEAMSAVKQLEPTKFYYKRDPNNEHVGFIAEDVPELVANPSRKSLSAMDITAVLTKVVQTQQEQLAAQDERIKKLEKALNRSQKR